MLESYKHIKFADYKGGQLRWQQFQKEADQHQQMIKQDKQQDKFEMPWAFFERSKLIEKKKHFHF